MVVILRRVIIDSNILAISTYVLLSIFNNSETNLFSPANWEIPEYFLPLNAFDYLHEYFFNKIRYNLIMNLRVTMVMIDKLKHTMRL